MNILDFVEKFKDEKTCKEYLRDLRMKEGVVCKHCGSKKHYERIEINVKCDKCGDKFIINHVNYNNNVRRNGFFGCIDCCKVLKFKKTCLEKYGVENPSNIESVVEKRKMTQIKNCGYSNYMQSEERFNMYKENNKIKYGYEMPFNSKEILQKCSDTINKKYGVVNIFQLDKTKEKIKEFLMEKYGGEYPLSCPEIKNKFIFTMIKKYGVNNPSKYQKFKDKVIQTKIKNGYTFDDSEWSEYKRNVRCITTHNKKELFNNWDGYDYYDHEYIKENFKLKYLSA